MIMSQDQQSKAKPSVYRFFVTPEMAMDWLENYNTNNRRLSEKRIQVMARDIAEGRWRLTHVGIAFATDGTLIDGQHRLWAVIEAGIAVEFFVWRNVDPKTMMVIDCGQKPFDGGYPEHRGRKRGCQPRPSCRSACHAWRILLSTKSFAVRDVRIASVP